MCNKLEGLININPSGYAFVTIENIKQDIFIPKNKTACSIKGDKVKVRFLNNRITGEVIEIIERKKEH